ncbi:MAG: D-aminoacyl-tRNA deacylase, partial [archaeon]
MPSPKKYLIIASKLDKAGINITTKLSQFRKNPLMSSMANEPSFDFYLVNDEIIYTKNLDLERINKYDFIIFASKHKSEKREKTLSVHAPGNWREAMYGGEAGKISKTSAQFLKQIFEKLKANADEHMLTEYQVTLECTHHGPLID